MLKEYCIHMYKLTRCNDICYRSSLWSVN